jgi:beta-glucosidase
MGSAVNAQVRSFSQDAKQKAEALLKPMTLDGYVGQLNRSGSSGMPGIAEEKPDNLIINNQS